MAMVLAHNSFQGKQFKQPLLTCGWKHVSSMFGWTSSIATNMSRTLELMFLPSSFSDHFPPFFFSGGCGSGCGRGCSLYVTRIVNRMEYSERVSTHHFITWPATLLLDTSYTSLFATLFWLPQLMHKKWSASWSHSYSNENDLCGLTYLKLLLQLTIISYCSTCCCVVCVWEQFCWSGSFWSVGPVLTLVHGSSSWRSPLQHCWKRVHSCCETWWKGKLVSLIQLSCQPWVTNHGKASILNNGVKLLVEESSQ